MEGLYLVLGVWSFLAVGALWYVNSIGDTKKKADKKEIQDNKETDK